MTPTQRRLLGRTLKTLALALEHGRWSDAELWLLVEKAKPGLDELHADLQVPCDHFEISGRSQTPWDRVSADIEQHIATIKRLAKPEPAPNFQPHYTEPVCKPQGFGALFAGAGRGMDMSLPVGDR